MTDRYVVIGNPIAHSKSPDIHSDFAAQTGVALQYCKLLSPLDGFAQTLHMLQACGVKGASVTVPFKQQACELAQHRSPAVEFAQAANTLSWRADGLHADNTDGVGLCTDLERQLNAKGLSLKGATVVMCGAGGAASGCISAFYTSGVQQLVILNRTASKAHELAERACALGLQARGAGMDAAPSQWALGKGPLVLVNASASSLAGQGLPIQPVWFEQASLAYDMMYAAKPTPFVAQAREANPNLACSDGLGMLVFQAAAAFEGWTGHAPRPLDTLAKLRAALTAPSQGVR